MRPVRQTKDNCMAACWASILEIPLEDVPDYQEINRTGGSWMNAVNTWLSKHFGVIYVETERYLTPCVHPVGWHLINFDVPAYGDGGHAVVGFHGRAVWDPRGFAIPPNVHIEADTYGLLVPLNHELRTTWSQRWHECPCRRCAGAASRGAPILVDLEFRGGRLP